MADKYTEARLENWARANRESYRYTKSATAVFCDSLRYYYGMPKDSEEAVPAMPEINTWSAPCLQGLVNFFKAQAPRRSI